jgi:hypothetical protein
MQPIVAESVPRRARAIVFATVLATFAFLMLAPPSPEPVRNRGQHRLGVGKCPHAKVVRVLQYH